MTKRSDEVTRLGNGAQADQLRARMLVLGTDGGRGYAKGEELPVAPAAPATPPPSNPPGGTIDVRREVTTLGQGDQASQLLARSKILADPRAYIAAHAPEPATTVELAQAELTRIETNAKTKAAADARAALLTELGASSVEDAKRLLGVAPPPSPTPAAPVPPPAAPAGPAR